MSGLFETKLLKYKKHIIQVFEDMFGQSTSISMVRRRLILLTMQRE